ncbi:2699_t:CDS:1, partial [Gigaspora rosea]
IVGILREMHDVQLEDSLLNLKKNKKSDSQLEQVSEYGAGQSPKTRRKQWLTQGT